MQVDGAKSFGEPVINRRQRIARLTDAVPFAQQAGEARGSAQFLSWFDEFAAGSDALV